MYCGHGTLCHEGFENDIVLKDGISAATRVSDRRYDKKMIGYTSFRSIVGHYMPK